MARDFLVTFVIAWIWNKFAVIRSSWVNVKLGAVNYAIASVAMLLGANYMIATMMGYTYHLSRGFFIEREISFNSPDTHTGRGFATYWGVGITALGATLLVLYVVVDLYGWHPIWSRVTVGAVTGFAVEFLTNKYWTFRK
jgi:putative flippase GtrA